ncbi:MAG: ribosome-associated translation inhibitor RaiA [Myxococcota bacterium]
MQVSVTFRHLDPSEPLKQHALDKAAHIKKYLDDAAHVHVVLSAEKLVERADVQIASHGMMMRGKEESSDLYNSIDRAFEKIETQVKRYRDKLAGHKPREGARLKVKFNTFGTSTPEEQTSHLPKSIIESKEVEARPMSIEEASMQMDLLDSELLVFLNVKTEHLNILYRKKGRHQYGLIEAL